MFSIHIICRAKEKLQSSITKVVLVRHIFQSLILGSGINWAQDEDMTDLVLGLGQSIDSQIEQTQNTNLQR